MADLIFKQGGRYFLPLDIFLPLGHVTQERGGGSEYLIVTKIRLVLVSTPSRELFYQGQKYNISNFIRGICPLYPTAVHASVYYPTKHLYILVPAPFLYLICTNFLQWCWKLTFLAILEQHLLNLKV